MHRLALVFAIGCAVDRGPSPGPTPPPQPAQPTFAQDSFYTGIVPPYATPEDCEAQASNPIMCHLELGFCAGGVAGFSNFDLPERGEYYLDGSIVVATFTPPNGGSNEVIQLDTETGSATPIAETDTYIPDTVGRWDTLQFDSGGGVPGSVLRV